MLPFGKFAMIKIIPLFFLLGVIWSQNCKVMYNDDSIVPGDLQILDRKFLYFIPKGSVKTEKVSVQKIKELRMIDGVLPILYGSVKYLYVDGSLIKNHYEGM